MYRNPDVLKQALEVESEAGAEQLLCLKKMMRLRGCIEELLKFTLESHINHTLDFHLALSQDFCSKLLTDDPNGNVSAVSYETLEGVPPYPLYKRLALALYRSIESGSFRPTYKKLGFIYDCVNRDEDNWSKLIQEKGSELINNLDAVKLELDLHLSDGMKVIEERFDSSDYERLEPGAWVLINKCFLVEIQDVQRHACFAGMFKTENKAEALPWVQTVEEGAQTGRKIYLKDKEVTNGVLAIGVSKVASQLHIPVASILSELDIQGIQGLLGNGHTVGTVSDGVPPPRSTLLSSFMLPYNPDVKGCLLTEGARALAKHINRSCDKFWGSFYGSDATKNRLAVDVINRIISNGCWINVHLVPPHGAVFEIRIAEGYGARWSKDGTEFIGFLEPYMEDGYSKRWKH